MTAYVVDAATAIAWVIESEAPGESVDHDAPRLFWREIMKLLIA